MCSLYQTSSTGTSTGAAADAGSCTIDGQTFPNRGLNPADFAQCCNAKTSPTAWLPLFSRAAIVPMQIGGNDEVSADFDSDGRDDVAIADGNGNVEVFFSESDGGWTSPLVLSTGEGPLPLRPVTGDLNGDGLQDLVVSSGAGGGGNWVFVFLNQGNHQFAPALSFPSPDGCRLDPVRVGDYDGDGWPDVVVGLARVGESCPDGQVGLFRNLGNGDGRLGAPAFLQSFGSGQNGDLRLGDFNGDGALDIAVADVTNTVGFFLNAGNGTFGAPTLNTALAPAPFQPYDLAAARFSPGADGLAVSSGSSSTVVVLGIACQALTKAGVSIGVSASYGPPTPMSGVLDVNGDGLPDAFFSNGGNTDILINQGNGTFLLASPAIVGQGGIQMITVGDLNGDGAPDLAVIDDSGNWEPWLNNCP